MQPLLVAFFIAFFQRGGGAVGYKQKHPYLMQLLYIFRFMTHGRR
nr:MAG TPA: transportin-1 [Caudoviricetes sp.]